MASICLSYSVSLPSRMITPTKKYPKRRGVAIAVGAQMPVISSPETGHTTVKLIATTYEQVAVSLESVLGQEAADKWKRALEILEEVFKSVPNSSAQGGDPTEFLLTSALLLLVFWLGNYVVPDWIFSKTVFRKTDETVGDDLFGSLMRERGNRKASSSEGSKPSMMSDSDAEASTSNMNRERKSVGFGTKVKSKHKRFRS